MADPIKDPTAFCIQAALSPTDPSLGSSKAGIAALDHEIERLELRIQRLGEARANILHRARTK